LNLIERFLNRRLDDDDNLKNQIIMKKILNLQVSIALLLVAAAFAATAQTTTYFTDNFGNGSTTNLTSAVGGSPTASSTSYDIASTKNTVPVTGSAGTNGVSIAPNDLHLALDSSTSSGFWEAQALFVTNSVGGTNAIALTEPGDYIDVAVVFSNSGTLFVGTSSTIWLGLFNSGGNAPFNAPVAGGLAQSGLTTASSSPYATGNCANWQGYFAQIENGGSATRIITRPLQNQGLTDSANQDLLGSNVGGGAFDNPAGATIETAPGSPSFTFTAGGIYTVDLRLTVNGANSLIVSNILYSGAGTNGPVLLAQGSATGITNATFLTGAFDGLAIGALNKTATYDPIMDVLSILITGTNTVISGPPTITSEPEAVTVATNGSCAFTVSAVGFNVTYQWQRNGTNLLNQGNISGANSSLLVVSPAGTNDVLSNLNGYKVLVSGAGGYSTNSVTNSLALVAATNLIWTDANPSSWDLNTTVNWQDNNSNPQVFNFGDPVTFNNVGGGGTVTLTGPYLSAASVTVSNTTGRPYVFGGSGSFAGPGNLIYTGTKPFTLNNANTYSGGTIISNALAYLNLENYAGLGTGPVTLAEAGGQMEIIVAGSASSGISGNIIVNDDFTILLDALGSFSGVFLGNLSGTVGKTLTLLPNNALTGNSVTNNRVRVYGINTTNNANLLLDDPLLTFAPYNTSGSQTYNGVISGSGAIMEKGATTYLNNGANTYSGGTFPVSGAIGLGSDSDSTPTHGPIGTGPLFLTVDSTTTLTGNGMLFAAGGPHTIANAIQYPTGTNNLTLVIGGTNNLTLSGAFTLNGNDLITTNTFTIRTVQVTNTALTTLSGVMSDFTNGISAAYGFTLTGGGVLALNNSETYTGPTTVSNGTLQVLGQLDPGSAVTVSSNATLSGTGTINGTVAVSAGGALAPGAATIGILNINNNLFLSGNVNVRVNHSGSVSDEVNVSGTPNNTGTGYVIVTNTGAALQVGDTFHIFNKAVTGGANLRVGGGGAGWNNQLGVNGTIIVSTVGLPAVSTAVSGSTLTLSWPAAYSGWEVQSNMVGLAFSTNWFTVPNTGGSTSYPITFNSAKTNVFYRLIFP
jgi:fibronectin-binding autotransporter adhesin